jgi:hypothetical protein
LAGFRQAHVLGQPRPGRAARGPRNVFGLARRQDVPAVRAAAIIEIVLTDRLLQEQERT